MTGPAALYVSAFNQGRTLEARRLAASWTEAGGNWSNQPATTGEAAAVATAPE